MSVAGPTISATRLKTIGGEKGEPGCERKYAAHYLFDMKQSGSPALEFGSALHSLAEEYQTTGNVSVPESELGRVFRSGIHLLAPDGAPIPEEQAYLAGICGPLLIEHEHVGQLPDGTEFVAYLDGHSARGGTTNLVVIQDLKTTSNPRYALESDPDSPHYLGADIQAMFYAWILLCLPHWYCPPLPADHAGPKHWQWWDPVERCAKGGRLRWVYFLSRGVPRAWDVSVFVTPAQAARFMQDTILPLAAKIVALHSWRAANPGATLSEIDRTLDACGGRGRWCGAGERDACEYGALGTPINDLIQLKVRKVTTPNERLLALKNNLANRGTPATGNLPVPETVAPKAPESAPVAAPAAATDSSAAPAAAPATVTAPAVAEPAKRTRAPRKPPASAGAGINPPESNEVTTQHYGAVDTDGDLAGLVGAVRALLPAGTSITITAGGAQ